MSASAPARTSRQHGKPSGAKAQAACSRCRQLRTKCNAARPSCNTCSASGSVCKYDTVDPSESRFRALRRDNVALQEQLAELVKSMDWLKSLPTQEASAWLQQLASSQSPVELRQALHSAMSGGGAQGTGGLSARRVSAACLPLHTTLAGVALAEEVPPAYPLDDPGLYSDVLDFLWWDSLGGQTLAGESEDTNLLSDVSRNSPKSAALAASYGPSARFVPGPKFAFHDRRLRRLSIDYWTTVPISSQSAAMIISLYLQYEHDGFGFFEPDLFVDDLVNQRTTFCSSFLVNSLLSWACRTYGFVDAESSLIGSLCFDAAYTLWQTERSLDSVLNVASLAVLGLGANGGGQPMLAAQFLVESVQMGERLGLFGETRIPAEAFAFLSDGIASQYAWVAWGAFNLSVIETWYFRGKAIGMLTTQAPLLPVPCRQIDDPDHNHDYAEHEPFLMPAFSRLWAILHEILMVYHEDYAPITERVPLVYAEAKFSQLMTWSCALPPALLRRDGMPHAVAMLHIVFHAIITDVFRPFRQLFVQSLGFQFQYRVGDVFECSAAQLRSLALDYYCRFKSTPATHSVSWITAILWGSNGTIAIGQKDQQANIIFFVQASANLLSSHPIMDRFVRGLLSMSVSADVLSLRQARRVLRRLSRTVTDNALGEAGWVTDLNLAMENPKAAVADALAQHFDDMSLEQEASS